ncbi:YagK/YfjJ domain-containing protein [Xenorhabdus griffiniae]|uniref:Inovirus-type Gp2 protein n=1 Tax=Xenorhabdus griffiniae TaxID=351672 RepID=A0ABY9XKT6_9GAMM|nr:inovirus-type Gp2 protein [Xenorhabdus griffiniae]WMV73471.1 inovirus-type Gp2 protein [Xenorhabdus griffiniae]WNH03150.1 inovirus-type Gp2 protein [Xenorhabdus griffiniae]
MKLPHDLTEKEFGALQQKAEEKYDSRISRYMLRRSLAVISNYLENYNRVFALRTDLRFAQSHVPDEPDMPTCFQKDDEKAITRAIESLKSQLREEHKRSGRAGEPTPLGYIEKRLS